MTATHTSPSVCIIKYNAGNVQSVLFALKRLGVDAAVSDDPAVIRAASHVIFPGVGQAKSAMQYLCERGLDKLIVSLKQPVLGICLGMQLMCSHSEEGDVACLGIFESKVKRFSSTNGAKVPQVGWNSLFHLKGAIFETISEKSYLYFVHSYYVELCSHTIATANYTEHYSAAIRKDNFYGVQFHPEKSGAVGEEILRRFLSRT